jgi:hypothetical protein
LNVFDGGHVDSSAVVWKMECAGTQSNSRNAPENVSR